MAGGLVACATGLASPAAAQDLTLEALKLDLDFVWMLVAAGLVLLMQAGFLLLEAGMVRSKNSINVAQKNFLDMAMSIVAFGAVGFMFSFGLSGSFPVGTNGAFFFLSDLTPWQIGFFVFQVMFCGTAATIVSGAVAERMRLVSYMICSVVVAAIIYPVFVHWAWGNALFDNASAFLANMGYVDFAGSTVVHATGAWVALAACMVMGPRIGRFDDHGKPLRITGHSPVLTAAGALLLFVGWIGFNGGSTTSATPAIAHIIANTVLAAGTGGVTGYLIGWYADGAVFPEKAVSGMLGGLVAVTAGCMVLDQQGALIVGAIGGAAALWGNSIIEEDFRIDDAVGAIGVHGFAGVAGTLSLALLAPVTNLPLGGRFEQLQVQAVGATVNFIWAFGIGYAFFWSLNRIASIRVTEDEEVLGLNEAEHSTRLGIGHVERALGSLVHGTADLDMRLPAVRGDESETLTSLFNALMDSLQKEEKARGEAAMVVRDEEEAERLSALANATFEAIWIHRDGRIIDGNRKLEELFDMPLDQLVGSSVIDLIGAPFRARAEEAVRNPIAEPFEAEVIRSDGKVVPVEMRGREIAYRGAPARIGCLVDLRERKNVEKQIRHLALHDPLTGLPNRTLFTERLEQMARQADSVVAQGALLVVDLDRFKDINDVHGHPAGDTVIKTTAERLRSMVGPTDTIARLGGDEFAILVPGLAFANQATDLAFRIVHQLGQPIQVNESTMVRPGASVGVAVCPRDGRDPEKLVSRADTALYQAKNSGRNTYCVFEEGMDALVEKRRLLEADLSDALDRDEFELHFQPRVSVDGYRVISYEALIRWNHPVKGQISPADFIPIAERSGKIVQIGDWVLRTACRVAGEHFGEARVSVNVSPVQFRQKDFVETVATILAETGFDPTRLEIEITEGVLIDDDQRARRILDQLKAIGISIALDDFGTGYSSLGYLSRFPFDTIKIDRSFVHDMTRSENARAIIRTIIGLGDGLNINVVAEGVEVPEEVNLLVAGGCRELQGFLLGRPVPVSKLRNFSSQAIAEMMGEAGDATDLMVGQLGTALAELRQPEIRRPARRAV